MFVYIAYTCLGPSPFPLIVRGCRGKGLAKRLSLARALECQCVASLSGCVLNLKILPVVQVYWSNETQYPSVVVTNCILTPTPAFRLC